MGSEATKIQKEEQKKIDEAQPLSEEEQAEKELLLTKVDNISFIILKMSNELCIYFCLY